MSKILQIAMAELGVKEIPGAQHNQRILDYARESDIPSIQDDETAWCSIFVNWCAKNAGVTRTNNPAARSWLNVGINPTTPEPGDVVIFWRGSRNDWRGHVGFFMGYSQNLQRIYVLGGNQGNQVAITAYSHEQLLGFRRLTASGIISLPDAPLSKGDRGPRVVGLQDALKALNYDAGTSDGWFGDKTEQALKNLQSSNDALTIDGIYGNYTKAFMEILLGS